MIVETLSWDKWFAERLNRPLVVPRGRCWGFGSDAAAKVKCQCQSPGLRFFGLFNWLGKEMKDAAFIVLSVAAIISPINSHLWSRFSRHCFERGDGRKSSARKEKKTCSTFAVFLSPRGQSIFELNTYSCRRLLRFSLQVFAYRSDKSIFLLFSGVATWSTSCNPIYPKQQHLLLLIASDCVRQVRTRGDKIQSIE